ADRQFHIVCFHRHRMPVLRRDSLRKRAFEEWRPVPRTVIESHDSLLHLQHVHLVSPHALVREAREHSPRTAAPAARRSCHPAFLHCVPQALCNEGRGSAFRACHIFAHAPFHPTTPDRTLTAGAGVVPPTGCCRQRFRLYGTPTFRSVQSRRIAVCIGTVD